MKKSIKMLTAAALAAAMTATMAVSAFADGAELNITYQYGLAYTPAVIAMDQGLIEAAYKEATGEDLTVNWTQMNNGSDINTAFAAGEIDAGFLALGPIVSGFSKGIGYKIFSNSSGQPHALMTNDPEVKEHQQLPRIYERVLQRSHFPDFRCLTVMLIVVQRDYPLRSAPVLPHG